VMLLRYLGRYRGEKMANLNTTLPSHEIKFLRARRDDFCLAREAVEVNISTSQNSFPPRRRSGELSGRPEQLSGHGDS
jgi:hypothetical protein